jgi:hypothetical protein
MAEDAVLRGGCECGAVEYEVADAFEYALTCHCSTCRASTGSMFKPFGGIAREQLRVVKGGDTLLVWGEADGNHTRCGVCGALLFSVVGPRVHVTYGSLRDEPTLKRLNTSSSVQRRHGRRSSTTSRSSTSTETSSCR